MFNFTINKQIFHKILFVIVILNLFQHCHSKHPIKVIFKIIKLFKIVVSIIEVEQKLYIIKYNIKSFTNVNEKLFVFITFDIDYSGILCIIIY